MKSYRPTLRFYKYCNSSEIQIPLFSFRKFDAVTIAETGINFSHICYLHIAHETRSSAIVDGPRYAPCQSNSCQLLHNSAGTSFTTNPEQIKVMKLEGYSRPTYNKLVHSATTRLTVVGVIHKLTVDEFVDNTCTPTTCCGEVFYKSTM